MFRLNSVRAAAILWQWLLFDGHVIRDVTGDCFYLLTKKLVPLRGHGLAQQLCTAPRPPAASINLHPPLTEDSRLVMSQPGEVTVRRFRNVLFLSCNLRSGTTR